jgi:hypothetical protein
MTFNIIFMKMSQNFSEGAGTTYMLYIVNYTTIQIGLNPL